MYSLENFIGTYTPFDIMLKILTENSSISFSFSVCNYSSASIKDAKIIITLKTTNIPYELEFNSSQHASSALELLKNTIDSLRNNCKEEQLQKNNPGAYYQGVELIKISLTSNTNGELNINWDYLQNINYDIEYSIYGDIFSLKRVKNITGGTYLITGLNPLQIYDIRIKRND